MSYRTLELDFHSGLALLEDDNDPPRYYIRQNRRMELIAIGNAGAARSRFAVRRSRAARLGGRAAAAPAVAAPREAYARAAEGQESGRA